MSGSQHITKQFDAELEAVRARVLQMGGLVEEQIVGAIEALTTGNIEQCERIIAADHRVNALEVEVDEQCSRIIARRQPTAIDLRMLLAVIKTITDLERIGDEASKIARMARALHQRDGLYLARHRDLRHVAEMAVDMLRKALDAFARLDASVTATVVRLDEHVDEEYKSMVRKLITYMMEDPRTISSSLEILWIVKAIERIGDHAKNMSEYVVYMVKGKDVRHVSADEIEREVGA
ncbi:MAG: phosphate signaling complex protein PhoU [Pseudomonadota bacterium]|jgi:phosphate transport system protein